MSYPLGSGLSYSRQGLFKWPVDYAYIQGAMHRIAYIQLTIHNQWVIQIANGVSK